ncbi:hypothetical protein Ddc_24374 [Ditylenchus destructor]|nr:hypothetical protein Ddc_24374 [Ditylenchus destructor]
MRLVEKYNLTSVTVPRFTAPAIISQDTTSTEVLVNVKFLDTGSEEMCIVNESYYESPMLIKTLYRHALSSLYSTGVCDSPLQYKLVNVRISDPNMGCWEDCECVDDCTFINGIVWRSRIYRFEVRQFKAGPSSQTANVSTSQSQPWDCFMATSSEQLTSKHDSFSRLNGPKHVPRTDEQSTNVPRCFAPAKILRDRTRIEILVNVNFLDTGIEKMCSVAYKNPMLIKTLYRHALSSLHSTRVCDSPSKYKLVNVRVSDPKMGYSEYCECEDDRTFINGIVWRSRIYSFEVRRLKGGASSQTANVSTSQSQSSTFMLPSEASTSLFGSISNRISTEIPVQVNFLDNGSKEICSVKHVGIMNILSLYSDALSNLYYKGVCDHPLEYKLVNVRISDPNMGCSEDYECVDFEDDRTFLNGIVWRSRIYSFEVRQLKGGASSQTANVSTSQSQSLTFKVLSTDSAKVRNIKRKESILISVQLVFLDSEEEKTVTVLYTNGMTVEKLFDFALLTLFNISSLFEIVTMHACDVDSTSDREPHNFDIPINVSSTVNSSYAYRFQVRRKTGEPSTSKECCQRLMKFLKLDDV